MSMSEKGVRDVQSVFAAFMSRGVRQAGGTVGMRLGEYIICGRINGRYLSHQSNQLLSVLTVPVWESQNMNVNIIFNWLIGLSVYLFI